MTSLNQYLNEQEDRQRKWEVAYQYITECDDSLQAFLREYHDDDLFVDVFNELMKPTPDYQLVGKIMHQFTLKKLEEYADKKAEE